MSAPVFQLSYNRYEASPVISSSIVISDSPVPVGHILLGVARTNNGASISWPTKFTVLVAGDTSDGSNDLTSIAWAPIDVDYNPATVDLTFGSSTRSAANIIRISGASVVENPEVSAFAVGTGTGANAPLLTHPGGSADTLWCTYCATEADVAWTSAPSGYTFRGGTAGDGGSGDTSSYIGKATRTLTAASEDPAAWGDLFPSSTFWSAFTVAVRATTIDFDADLGASASVGSELEAQILASAALGSNATISPMLTAGPLILLNALMDAVFRTGVNPPTDSVELDTQIVFATGPAFPPAVGVEALLVADLDAVIQFATLLEAIGFVGLPSVELEVLPDIMRGIRGRTVARFGCARAGASRFAFFPSDNNRDIPCLYSWKQVHGPMFFEEDEDSAWRPVQR